MCKTDEWRDAATGHTELSLVLWDDLKEWMGEVGGNAFFQNINYLNKKVVYVMF